MTQEQRELAQQKLLEAMADALVKMDAREVTAERLAEVRPFGATSAHQLILVKIFRRLGADPALQYKIHIWASVVWVVNAALAIACFIFLPMVWASASVLYLVLVSLYANFATDYGAIPATIGAIHAKAMDDKRQAQGTEY
jgi:hypothetical protein